MSLRNSRDMRSASPLPPSACAPNRFLRPLHQTSAAERTSWWKVTDQLSAKDPTRRIMQHDGLQPRRAVRSCTAFFSTSVLLMQGEVLSAMMRSVYASFAASAKISVLSVWPVAHPCSSRAERTGRHSRPSLSPPSFNARTKQPRQCSCSCYPSSPYLTSPHTALPPLLSSSHHPGVSLSDRCQMTTNTKRQSRHQRCMSATSIPTNVARFTAVGLC
jgi:hypothetical protein